MQNGYLPKILFSPIMLSKPGTVEEKEETRMGNKWLALLLSVMLLLSVACGASAMTAGTYSATVNAMHGPMTVEVTVSEDKIEKVEVVSNVETPGLIDWPMREIPAAIVENQSLAVDVVSGVTVSSRAILSAAKAALEQALGYEKKPILSRLSAKRAAAVPEELSDTEQDGEMEPEDTADDVWENEKGE